MDALPTSCYPRGYAEHPQDVTVNSCNEMFFQRVAVRHHKICGGSNSGAHWLIADRTTGCKCIAVQPAILRYRYVEPVASFWESSAGVLGGTGGLAALPDQLSSSPRASAKTLPRIPNGRCKQPIIYRLPQPIIWQLFRKRALGCDKRPRWVAPLFLPDFST
jgi:hypothetical protein